MTAVNFKRQLRKHANAEDAVFLRRFFKTGKGEYGEGDRFLGVRVPVTRKVCRAYRELPLAEVQKLFDSPYHEHRLGAVIVLTLQYNKANTAGKQSIFDLYLKNVRNGRVNNWDIVDVSAEHIIGVHLKDQSKELLFELAGNDHLWSRRVAMLSTFAYIKAGDAKVALEVAEKLLYDPHDLIHKAVGWMLREVGKRVDRQLLLGFLDKYAATMPRVALRYAIEHLPGEGRRRYLGLKEPVSS